LKKRKSFSREGEEALLGRILLGGKKKGSEEVEKSGKGGEDVPAQGRTIDLLRETLVRLARREKAVWSNDWRNSMLWGGGESILGKLRRGGLNSNTLCRGKNSIQGKLTGEEGRRVLHRKGG